MMTVGKEGTAQETLEVALLKQIDDCLHFMAYRARIGNDDYRNTAAAMADCAYALAIIQGRDVGKP